jgi:hypothetical protein
MLTTQSQVARDPAETKLPDTALLHESKMTVQVLWLETRQLVNDWNHANCQSKGL